MVPCRPAGAHALALVQRWQSGIQLRSPRPGVAEEEGLRCCQSRDRLPEEGDGGKVAAAKRPHSSPVNCQIEQRK